MFIYLNQSICVLYSQNLQKQTLDFFKTGGGGIRLWTILTDYWWDVWCEAIEGQRWYVDDGTISSSCSNLMTIKALRTDRMKCIIIITSSNGHLFLHAPCWWKIFWLILYSDIFLCWYDEKLLILENNGNFNKMN